MQFIVTALASEARPLLDHYRLRGSGQAAPFNIYRNDTMALVISGLGRVNAAAACAYLGALFAAPDQAHSWLNIGIAGQRDLPLGSAHLAHSIYGSCGSVWYPPLVFTAPCSRAAVCTIDEPTLNYPDTKLYEMEAAGFYPTACRFASAECVQCLKVISDNQQHPVSELNASKVSTLIADNLDIVEALLQQLNELAGELQQSLDIAALPELPWRASVSQQHQLRRLLQRYRVVCQQEPDLTTYADVKSCLQVLQTTLEQHESDFLLTCG